ncbi:MAG: MarC family protein [Planctomycetes bacterium]|nr:MarC family protein [Planctomycetota bacterium]
MSLNLDLLNGLLMAFISLFVAVDPPGLLPIVEGLLAGADQPRRRRVLARSIMVALVVGVLFLFLGRAVLQMLGITEGDFKVAGGVLLFVIALKDMLSDQQAGINPEELGAVPLGVPLIVGPATLTSLLILSEHHGMGLTLVALVANLAVVGVLLWLGGWLTRLLGNEGAKVMSKVSHLLLAAFAVMMIRLGVIDIITQVDG